MKIYENCVFEAFFLATWAEAQSWKQVICYFYLIISYFNYSNCFLRKKAAGLFNIWQESQETIQIIS